MKINVVSILLLVACIVLIPIYNVAFLNIYDLAKPEDCPFCYGTTMCECLSTNNFASNWHYFWANLINLYIGNKVIFGSCDGKSVVIKIFGGQLGSRDSSCNEDLTFSDIQLVIKNLSMPQFLNPSQKFKLCPSVERVETLLSPLMENTERNSKTLTELMLNLCFMMEVNIEPIVQQITSQWAVAEYLGSCGGVGVSKFCGSSLTWVFPRLTWRERSSIAVQLLQFAFNATFDHPTFAFYFTDLSPDNFAVSSEGDVRLVDLEHVIVVDKYPADEPDHWDIWHKSYHDNTVSGFTFSPEEVCSHQTSDLNIYEICLGILSEDSELLDGGLLKSPPQQVTGVQALVGQCVSPRKGQSRFDVASSIMNKLNHI